MTEHRLPLDIEGESMRIIQAELDRRGIVLPPDRAGPGQAVGTKGRSGEAAGFSAVAGAAPARGREKRAQHG